MAQARRATGARRRPRSGEESRSTRQGRARRDTEYEHSAHTGAAGASQAESEPSAVDIERLQMMASEMAPQLGAAAVAAIATAVLLPEFLPAVLIGAGATLMPRLLPGAGSMFRPMMKTMLRAGYAAFATVQNLAAEAGEQLQDVMAEVQAEQHTRGEHGAQPGGGRGAETRSTAAH